jgi:hypothetical protein
MAGTDTESRGPRSATATARSALATMVDTLAADGYRLDISVPDAPEGSPPKVRLVVTAGPDACAECLVPKQVFSDIASAALGGRFAVELHYPEDSP